MGVTRTIHPKYPHKFQLIADLDQDPPVQNTWYTMFDGTGGIRIRMMTVKQINDEAAAKTIELRMTIDGTALVETPQVQSNDSWYYWTVRAWTDRVYGDDTAPWLAQYYKAVECHDVLIEVRMTSAPGTNQKLDGRVHYETFERLPG